jgi:hypothetical protein
LHKQNRTSNLKDAGSIPKLINAKILIRRLTVSKVFVLIDSIRLYILKFDKAYNLMLSKLQNLAMGVF